MGRKRALIPTFLTNWLWTEKVTADEPLTHFGLAAWLNPGRGLLLTTLSVSKQNQWNMRANKLRAFWFRCGRLLQTMAALIDYKNKRGTGWRRLYLKMNSWKKSEPPWCGEHWSGCRRPPCPEKCKKKKKKKKKRTFVETDVGKTVLSTPAHFGSSSSEHSMALASLSAV